MVGSLIILIVEGFVKFSWFIGFVFTYCWYKQDSMQSDAVGNFIIGVLLANLGIYKSTTEGGYSFLASLLIAFCTLCICKIFFIDFCFCFYCGFFYWLFDL